MSNLNNMFGTSNVAIPDEGPKCIRVDYDFSTEDHFDTEGLLATTTGTMSYIQGAFVDNRDNPEPLVIKCAVIQQEISIPSHSQGYVPLLIQNPPRFTISTTPLADLGVSIWYYNVPIQPMIWGANGQIITGTITAINTGPTLSDFSNTNLDGTSEEVIATGEAASYLAMFAPAGNADIVNVNLAGGDALASFIELSPGGSVTIESGLANAVTVAAISVGDSIMVFGG